MYLDKFFVVWVQHWTVRPGDATEVGTTASPDTAKMDVKVVYADPNGALSILPDSEAAAAGSAGVSSWRPSSVPLTAAYLTLSSAAIAANAMVLTGIVAVDRLRSPYAVLASALCMQCALDAAAGHYVATRELMLTAGGSGGGGGGPVLCRCVATVTAALSVVQLVTFAALACLNAIVRPGHEELSLPAAAALWAAPSIYTYVMLTPTLLFSTRYFPSRYDLRRFTGKKLSVTLVTIYLPSG